MKWALILFVLNTQDPVEQHFFSYKGVETQEACLAESEKAIRNMPKIKDIMVFSQCIEIKELQK